MTHYARYGYCCEQDPGRRVREGREVMGLSTYRFGLMVGLCGTTIRKLEQGDANVRLDTLERVASGLGTEAWLLLRRDAPREPM